MAALTSGGGKRLVLLVLVLCLGVSRDCWVKRSRSGDTGRPHWCLFMWSARWSEREKQRPQWWHLKGLAPVCFLKWRVSSSERANLHSQPSHEHRYGFSPVGEEKGIVRGNLRRDHMRVGGGKRERREAGKRDNNSI